MTHYGDHFTVENARIFDLPDSVPPIVFSAFGPRAAALAAREGDGLWITGIKEDVINTYRVEGGTGPVWTQLSLCWDPNTETAIDRAHRIWPNTEVPGQLSQDLRTVLHFEQACEVVSRDQIAESIPCGPNPEPIIDGARQAREAGADRIYFHQIGDPCDGFIEFFKNDLQPQLAQLG